MPRRGKTPKLLLIRASHEATRSSKAQYAAAFECLVPVLERRVRPPPLEATRDPTAATTWQAGQRIGRG
jgi:hypothetical protein